MLVVGAESQNATSYASKNEFLKPSHVYLADLFVIRRFADMLVFSRLSHLESALGTFHTSSFGDLFR